MGNAIRAFLYGASSIVDISGIRGISQLRSMHKKYVEKGVAYDNGNIASDFHNSIKKLKK